MLRLAARTTEVGGLSIRRALPQRGLRTVGPWCFADHMGPEIVTPTQGLDVGPHPHIGLHTATWLFDGAVVHTDSLGTEQLIRPGELNLMTAGHGIVHAEQADRIRSQTLHGIQLWLAQPDAYRHGEPAFAHHADLTTIESETADATVFLGSWAAVRSTVTVEHPGVGVDIAHRPGTSTWELDRTFEYAVYCAAGEATVNESPIREGELIAWGPGSDEVTISSSGDARLILLGGEPWVEPLFMWWNFVARSKAEVAQAISDWTAWSVGGEHPRFAPLTSALTALPAPVLPRAQPPDPHPSPISLWPSA